MVKSRLGGALGRLARARSAGLQACSHGRPKGLRYIEMRNALAATLLCGGVLSAQQTNPNPPQAPTFKSSVQVIEVDVRVFDKDGRFVTTLTRDDFEIVEEGAPQKVEAMFLVGADQPLEPAQDTPPVAAPDARAAARPGPAAPQTWIFHFDLNHLTPGAGFDRARKAVEDFIATRFKDGDLAGVLAGDKMINNRLTSVRQELLDAVKQVKPRSDARTRDLEMTREWPRLLTVEEAIQISRNEREATQRAVVRACGDDSVRCPEADLAVPEKGRLVANAFHRSATATMTAINALASGLARIPGPKTVVFLSDGFVTQQVETTLRSVVGQTARAGARVYAIDVRGLNRVGNAGSIEQPYADDEAGPVMRTDSYADGPNSLAIDTGGMMIRNENNIGRALSRIADDAGRYYVLAYRPANTMFDGKFRAIQVRVKKEGLRVRARRGYLALDPARMTVPQPLKPAGDAAPVAAEKQPEAVVAAPADAAIEPKTPATPTAMGTVVVSPPTATAGTVRLRPDTETRVNALSSRDGAPVGDRAKSGWDAYQRGDVEKAMADLTQAAAQPAARPWVHYALGMSQVAMGRASDAIASWERVRQAAPDFEPVYMDLADTYSQVGELTRSLAVLRDAEKRWPKSATVQSAIGVIQVSRGALDEGITHLVEAAAAAPEDPLMHLNLGRAYSLRFQRGRRYVTSQRRWVAPEGDRQKAVEAFQRCITLGGPYAQQARDALSVLEWSK